MTLTFEYHYRGAYPKGKAKWAVELREEIDDIIDAFEKEMNILYREAIPDIKACNGRIEVDIHSDDKSIGKCFASQFSDEAIQKVKEIHSRDDMKHKKWIILPS